MRTLFRTLGVQESKGGLVKSGEEIIDDYADSLGAEEVEAWKVALTEPEKKMHAACWKVQETIHHLNCNEFVKLHL